MAYHIFTQEKEIVLDKGLSGEKMVNGTVYMAYDSTESLKLVVEALNQNNKATKFIIVHHDLDLLFRAFSSLFENVIAAGGLVKNKDNEYLLIFRNGRWDLPKGKLDAGENIEDCALREVKEECGINNLSILKKLPSTYHIYTEKEKQILKITHWFEMKSSDSCELKPQRNEGIEKAVWVTKEEAKKLLSTSFASLKNFSEAALI
jgi:ADP-ribose pyrophosphatase YjhB (NUDIX family)